MKGYVYITGQGADPHYANDLKDPVFKPVPSLGACMPNIRRAVSLGDWIFLVSGKRPKVQQYVVGGFMVAEKLDAITAYNRFPEYRLYKDDKGKLRGNIIITHDGMQSPLDTHQSASFESRIKNYIVGKDAVHIETDREVTRSRGESIRFLSGLVGKPVGNRAVDVIGRGMRKLDEQQVGNMLDWLKDIKRTTQ